eukprot:gnl/MRDRNA2_/MRDRNA2_85930_c0_seq2.p3 gnl/MRDRNA2_/MRDRNA2_85930_c0~~gnl/MRDRNA2_/MRDRNA2_85930_c0_seq2.p3  ORF type:complete len:119 (+),score=6.38 gnl/MRDRNA2_/MRDRNA2_85930_c0_seq2:507-863(+)
MPHNMLIRKSSATGLPNRRNLTLMRGNRQLKLCGRLGRRLQINVHRRQFGKKVDTWYLDLRTQLHTSRRTLDFACLEPPLFSDVMALAPPILQLPWSLVRKLRGQRWRAQHGYNPTWL